MDPATLLNIAKDAQSIALVLAISWVSVEIKVNHALRKQLAEARKEAKEERSEWLSHHTRFTEVISSASAAMDTAVRALERIKDRS
jgi:vacuolar-type H+-ATPase subunit H